MLDELILARFAGRFGGGKGGVERGRRMRAQIVFDQRDLLSVGKMYVGQFLEHLRVRRRGATVVATISFPIALAGALREAHLAIELLAVHHAQARLHAVLRIGDAQQLPNRSGLQRPLRHCEEPLRRSNPGADERGSWIASLRSQ